MMKSNTFRIIVIATGVIIVALCCFGYYLFTESQAIKDAEIADVTLELLKKDSLKKSEQAELQRIEDERVNSINREVEASIAREKATDDRFNELMSEINIQQNNNYVDNSMNNTKDLSLLTTGRWYANASDTDTDWWYTYMSDGTGRLKVRVPNFNNPIDVSFSWTISKDVLSVSWDSEFAAIAGVRGWTGEIRKLNNEILEIYDNRSYSRDVYKHIR